MFEARMFDTKILETRKLQSVPRRPVIASRNPHLLFRGLQQFGRDRERRGFHPGQFRFRSL
jgi:hypothetical protein